MTQEGRDLRSRLRQAEMERDALTLRLKEVSHVTVAGRKSIESSLDELRDLEVTCTRVMSSRGEMEREMERITKHFEHALTSQVHPMPSFLLSLV